MRGQSRRLCDREALDCVEYNYIDNISSIHQIYTYNVRRTLYDVYSAAVNKYLYAKLCKSVAYAYIHVYTYSHKHMHTLAHEY